MTSAEFRAVPINSVVIERNARQRRELEGIEVLADSIRRLGLIHPPVVTRDMVLVSGERRMAAIRSLGWDRVPVQFQDECDGHVLYAIELEENIKRSQLPWQEECVAVQQYHKLRKNTEGPDWTLDDTGLALGLSRQQITTRSIVADELAKPDSIVKQTNKFSTALNMVRRAEERRQAADVDRVLTSATLTGIALERERPQEIINTNFLEWAPEYRGPPFNFIHCDFPYGINAHKFGDAFTLGDVMGKYEDTPENYHTLIDCLLDNLDRLMSPSGHLIFWFSMRHYQTTLDCLSDKLEVDPFPLVWHKSDNAGNSPNPQRLPRRVYETAFFASRGDHPIVRTAANIFSAPTVANQHMSEKPQGMLSHFFRMVVDGHTSLLDPTAGSGSALRAAKLLGAERVLGLEINPVFAQEAAKALEAV